jgi:long-subunit fatty acid transport protein
LLFLRTTPLWTSGVGTAAYQFEYNMEAWTFGLNAGIIAELSPEFNLALSVRSAYSADLEGDAKSRLFAVTDSTDEVTDIKSAFEMPWILGVGAVYSFSPEININFDIQYSLWGSTQESASISFNNSIWQNSLNQTDPGSGVDAGRFNYEYRNTLDIGLGFEYISSGNISYRAGYLFSQSQNSEVTYNMLFPSVDRHTLTIGAGLSEGNLQFDAALLYSFGVRKEVSDMKFPS